MKDKRETLHKLREVVEVTMMLLVSLVHARAAARLSTLGLLTSDSVTCIIWMKGIV